MLFFSSTIALLAAYATARSLPITLFPDDIILHGSNRYQILKRSDFDLLQAARNSSTLPPTPGYLSTSLFHAPPTSPPSKRARTQTLIIKHAPSRFLGWDVLMSAIVHGAPTTLSISSGYTLSNSITVGASSTFTLVKDFLQASLKIDYSTSWLSSQTQQFQAQVPEGKYGAFVSNPWTNRESGFVFEGRIGGEGELTMYQGDSFESKEYGGLEWVDGVISLCVGEEVPLKRCLGDGTL
ncbi:hypothetical protein EJ04DRAFT_562676 [Polyplosphaeria fusca]|uniref:Uncharacterized protein n=1 Tax=Polyplosphaeria fusca TaxID=682080 RepID=A0A9P4R3J1_9PLEO|nr:hypothetical protein EJ04DRAFT_562676 [Polyplosphaeria fusca]